jgi:hypothetical protein
MQGKREVTPDRLAEIASKAVVPAPTLAPAEPMALVALTPAPADGALGRAVVPVTAEPIDPVGERR